MAHPTKPLTNTGYERTCDGLVIQHYVDTDGIRWDWATSGSTGTWTRLEPVRHLEHGGRRLCGESAWAIVEEGETPPECLECRLVALIVGPVWLVQP